MEVTALQRLVICNMVKDVIYFAVIGSDICVSDLLEFSYGDSLLFDDKTQTQ
jgi:hypothetical protein